MSDIAIRVPCPSCGKQSLIVSLTGWLVCTWVDCPQPDLGKAIDALYRDRYRDRQRLNNIASRVFQLYEALTDTPIGYPT